MVNKAKKNLVTDVRIPPNRMTKIADYPWHIIFCSQEFQTICKSITEEQVKMAFHKFDTSGDDKLDYREFCEMIKIQEENKKSKGE